MRTVTFNIQHGAKGLDRVSSLLRALVPDIVFLQEVDRGCHRSGGVDQVAILAHALSMEFAFAEAFAFDGGAYGVALLSRWPLRQVRTLRLPHPSPRRDDGHGEPRVLLLAEADRFTVASTHLGLTAEERVEQARFIRRELESLGRFILGGDLNEGPGGAVVREWAGWLGDSFEKAGGSEGVTAPEDRPATRIDFVLRTEADLRPTSAQVGPAGYSDHRAVIVDFAG